MRRHQLVAEMLKRFGDLALQVAHVTADTACALGRVIDESATGAAAAISAPTFDAELRGFIAGSMTRDDDWAAWRRELDDE